ncbi:hypothetical protein [Xanthomonas arboricola]|uniref:hypothetical protein n=1 Tax=Xanthomonas arboricola TaxID=56448 RepID=UPI0017A93F88
MSLASCSSLSARRAVIASCTPSAASTRAMPAPIPVLAPVTSAVCSRNCRSIDNVRLSEGPSLIRYRAAINAVILH